MLPNGARVDAFGAGFQFAKPLRRTVMVGLDSLTGSAPEYRSPTHAMPAPTPSSTPPRPRLVLRLGFAGRRELTTDETRVLDESLDRILNAVENCLAGLAPGVPVKGEGDLKITSFYSEECPVLRIVTGLCADDRAAEALSRIRIDPDDPLPVDAPVPCLSPELAAVLPFSPEAYRASRAADFRLQFDDRLSQCAWVIALDGLCDKPAEDLRRLLRHQSRSRQIGRNRTVSPQMQPLGVLRQRFASKSKNQILDRRNGPLGLSRRIQSGVGLPIV